MHELETALGHGFSDESLLRQALIHRSYAAEHLEQRSNERYEFLGDAVLQLVVTRFIFSQYPELEEGSLAKVRAAAVSGERLASMARHIGVGEHVMLGRGEQATGGNDKDSILADTMEAILAAVYLDEGLGAAEVVILKHLESSIRQSAEAPGREDYKTRLQELVASRGVRPKYRVTDQGLDHEKTFEAVVEVAGDVVGRGSGTSKKAAEQSAAAEALAHLADH